MAVSTVDSTAAFEADAAKGKDLSTEELRALLQDREGAVVPADPAADVLNADGTQYVPGNSEDEEVLDVHDMEVKGTVFQFHLPKTAALLAFGMGASDRRNVQTQISTLRRFLQFSLTDESWDQLLDRMMDPRDDFSDEDMADMVSHIADKSSKTSEAKAPKNGPVR